MERCKPGVATRYSSYAYRAQREGGRYFYFTARMCVAIRNGGRRYPGGMKIFYGLVAIPAGQTFDRLPRHGTRPWKNRGNENRVFQGSRAGCTQWIVFELVRANNASLINELWKYASG